MKFKIEFNYEDKNEDNVKDYELNVSSDFCDESAKLVSEILAHFNQKLAEHKNNTRFIKGEKIIK